MLHIRVESLLVRALQIYTSGKDTMYVAGREITQKESLENGHLYSSESKSIREKRLYILEEINRVGEREELKIADMASQS